MPKAPIKTYSRRRVDDYPRKKRKLQDLSSSDVNSASVTTTSLVATEDHIGSTGGKSVIHSNKRKQLHSLTTSVDQSKNLKRHQQGTANDCESLANEQEILPRSSCINSSKASFLSTSSTRDTSTSKPVQSPGSFAPDPLSNSSAASASSTKLANSPRPPSQLLKATKKPHISVKKQTQTDIKKGSITNYFKPVEIPSPPTSALSSSSPSSGTSIFSNLQDPASTPPSPPPSPFKNAESRDKIRKRPRRLRSRITTDMDFIRDSLARWNNEHDLLEEIVGSGDDASGVELMERHFDREEIRDAELSGFDHRKEIYDDFRKPRLMNKQAQDHLSSQTDIGNGRITASVAGSLGSADPGPSKPIPMPPGRPQATGGNWKKQTQLAYRQPDFKVCSLCGLMYAGSLKNDQALHVGYCRKVREGNQPKVDREVRLEKWRDMDGKVHAIHVIEPKNDERWRRYALAVLDISYQDLGGPPVGDEKLWSEFDHSQAGIVPRFKVYIYSLDDKPIGLILAESIEEGGQYHVGEVRYSKDGPVVPDPNDLNQQVYSSLDMALPVFACVDRIWVHTRYRRQGIATKLVDSMRSHFITNMPLRRHQIAFSIPTTPGYNFAESYCKDVDWARYIKHKDARKIRFLVNTRDVPFVIKNNKLESNHTRPNRLVFEDF